MARCRATTPCDFEDDVHDFGCPERGRGIADPELRELYATETAEERDWLDDVLTHLIDRDLLDTDGYADAEPSAVTGGDAEWLALRRAVRASGSLTLADGFELTWHPDGITPELHVRTATA